MFSRALRLVIVGFACLAGCGRLAYQTLPPDASDAQMGSHEGGTDAGPDADVPDATSMDTGMADTHVPDAEVADADRLDAATDAALSSDAQAMSEAGVDATAIDAGPSDAGIDGRSDVNDAGQDAGPLFDPPPCEVGVLWETDFASDPTMLDRNNDSMPDWIVRGGGTFPAGEIVGGTWTSAGQVPLDTHPPLNIVTTAYIDVRLRSLRTPAAVTTDFEGALFWVNVDYTVTDFAPLFVSVSRTATDQQEVRFYGKSADAVGVVLLGPITTGPEMLHVQMEIDPVTSTMRGWIDGTLIGTAMFPRVSDRVNADQFATAFAASTPAEYDAARIAVCVP